MKIESKKYLGWSKVRSLCIFNEWYTRGNNEQYEKMLNMADVENITDQQLFEIASDIFKHSDLPQFSDYTVLEAIEHIMFELNQRTVTTYTLTMENE